MHQYILNLLGISLAASCVLAVGRCNAQTPTTSNGNNANTNKSIAISTADKSINKNKENLSTANNISSHVEVNPRIPIASRIFPTMQQ